MIQHADNPVKADTGKLTFIPGAEIQKYGDNRIFFEYTIRILRGKRVVGIEIGPRRTTQYLHEAMDAARERIEVLRSHRLYVIRVTRKNIGDGEARNCNTCAISQALWCNQERMGLPRSDFNLEVHSYGAWVDCDGITISKKYGEQIGNLPVEQLPTIVMGPAGKYTEDMPT